MVVEVEEGYLAVVLACHHDERVHKLVDLRTACVTGQSRA